MKFSIFGIIRDHLATLKNDRTGRRSWVDLVFLYGVPFFFMAISFLFQSEKLDAPIGVFVSATSVFAAILVSSQFAIHSLLSRSLPSDEDSIEESLRLEERRTEIEVLGEIHATISYAIALGVVALLLSIILAILPTAAPVEASVLGYVGSHFALTILIVVRRVHSLLDRSYSNAIEKCDDALAAAKKK